MLLPTPCHQQFHPRQAIDALNRVGEAVNFAMQQRLAKADFILRGILQSGDLKVCAGCGSDDRTQLYTQPLPSPSVYPLLYYLPCLVHRQVMEAKMRKHLKAGELDMAFDVILNINAQQAR